MRTIAETGNWTLDAQVRAYDFLDTVAGVDAGGLLQNSVAENFCKEYDALAPTLVSAYDENSLQIQAKQSILPAQEAVAKAEKRMAQLTDLHECAKQTFEIWQTKGLFARQKAIRTLRSKAGFRLETKRIGNYVAKTFDLMNEARAVYAHAQQTLFLSDMSYKIKPGVYSQIRKCLDSFVSENNPLTESEI